MNTLLDVLRRLLGVQPAESPAPEAGQISSETVNNTSPTVPRGAEVPTVPSRGEQKNRTDEAVVVAPSDVVTATLDSDGRTRQLPPLDSVVSKATEGARLNIGQRSHVGQIRDNNQDAMLTFLASMSGHDEQPTFGLFIVADGMGGHEDGEKASATATQIITMHVTNDIFIPLLNGETGGNSERPTIVEILRNALQKANEVVSERVPDGGTTATAAVVMGKSAYIAHVGDSRAYLIAHDMIEIVTRDHSLVARLIELDQLSPEDAIEHPQRNVLYRALGQSDNLEVDAIIRQIPAGGYLMLCSDGLWNLVTKEDIQRVILEYQNNTQGACEELVGLANDRGGSDNITVVIVRVPN